MRDRQMSAITLYHNPECGTSRNTLALIRNSGVEPTIIHYLETPPATSWWPDRRHGHAGARSAAKERAPTRHWGWQKIASAMTN